MKLKNVILSLSLVMLSTPILAMNLKSSNISLIQSTIAPHESLSIPTSNLIEDADYIVTCRITDANNEQNKVIMRATRSSGGYYYYDTGSITLDGTLLSYGSSVQFSLPTVDSFLKFDSVTSNSTLSITNLDQSDSITVNCSATASVNSR